MRVLNIQLLALPALVALTGFAALQLESGRSERAGGTPEQTEEVLYLPNGRALQFISFGYRNALAQLLWFNTISYFGKHYRQDQNYRWLAHMCRLVNDLNPLAEHVYLFCSAMLSWEAGAPQAAVTLLSRGIEMQPANWYLYYLRGFTYMLFLKDAARAKEDLVAASKLPGAEPFVARIAAKKIAELDTPQTAVEFLQQMLLGAGDPAARQALDGKLQDMLRKKQ